MPRPDWDEYFLGIAEAVAARSDCERSKVGAVIVKDRRIRATGYNGAPSGAPGCGSCPRRLAGATPGVSSYDTGPTRCVAIHAEANALLHCDREDLAGAALYVTREPCYACWKLIQAVGITKVHYPPARRELNFNIVVRQEDIEVPKYTLESLIRERDRQWWAAFNRSEDQKLADAIWGPNPNIIRGEN